MTQITPGQLRQRLAVAKRRRALESIARATLPLSIFGARDYAPIMGKLAMPSLIAQASAPSIGAFLIQVFSIDTALAVVVGAAVVNVTLGITLLSLTTGARLRAAE